MVFHNNIFHVYYVMISIAFFVQAKGQGEGGGSSNTDLCWQVGRMGVQKGPKYTDIILEQPLICISMAGVKAGVKLKDWAFGINIQWAFALAYNGGTLFVQGLKGICQFLGHCMRHNFWSLLRLVYTRKFCSFCKIMFFLDIFPNPINWTFQ